MNEEKSGSSLRKVFDSVRDHWAPAAVFLGVTGAYGSKIAYSEFGRAAGNVTLATGLGLVAMPAVYFGARAFVEYLNEKHKDWSNTPYQP